MADTKVSALTAASALAGTEELPIVQSSTSKKVTPNQLLTYLQTKGMPRVTRLNSQHQLASTTATEVTDLSQTLEAGTYVFKYSLIIRTATATVSPMYGVNFTGTAAVRKMSLMYNDAGPLTAGTGQVDDVGSTAGNPVSGMQVTAFSTSTPNMGHTGGIASTAADAYIAIEGILIVTASGDLELWHGSETATNTSIEIGSSLVVIRTA